MSPTGEIEELCQRLLEELVLEDKLQRNLEKLQHCNAPKACLIALLQKFRVFYMEKIELE
jgi:hypothetical protein